MSNSGRDLGVALTRGCPGLVLVLVNYGDQIALEAADLVECEGQRDPAWDKSAAKNRLI